MPAERELVDCGSAVRRVADVNEAEWLTCELDLGVVQDDGAAVGLVEDLIDLPS